MLEKTTCVENSDTLLAGGHFAEKKLAGVKKTGIRGQTLTEYAILITMVLVALLGVVGVFISGIGSYYLNLIKIITLPFP